MEEILGLVAENEGTLLFLATLLLVLATLRLAGEAQAARLSAILVLQDHARLARFAYIAGMLGNVAIIGLYLVTRTIGIPAGPHAGMVEEVTTISVVSKVMEVGIIICLVQLLRMPIDDRQAVKAA